MKMKNEWLPLEDGSSLLFDTKGRYLCTLDSTDLETISGFTWCADGSGYAIARRNGKGVYLHHTITGGRVHGKVTDHIDRDKANNRRENLRTVTQSENLHNKGKVRGYSFHKRDKKWCAYITVNYEHIRLGAFKTEAEARAAHLDAKKIYHPSAPAN